MRYAPAGPRALLGVRARRRTRSRAFKRCFLSTRPNLLAFVVLARGPNLLGARGRQNATRRLANTPGQGNFPRGHGHLLYKKSRGDLRLVDISRTPKGTFF